MSWFDDQIHGEQIVLTRVTTGKPDANGRAKETTVSHTLDGYSVTPVGSDESVGDEKVVTSRYRVSGPSTDLVRAQDRVTWRGEEYEVAGRPQTFHGAFPHTEFFMQMDRG